MLFKTPTKQPGQIPQVVSPAALKTEKSNIVLIHGDETKKIMATNDEMGITTKLAERCSDEVYETFCDENDTRQATEFGTTSQLSRKLTIRLLCPY